MEKEISDLPNLIKTNNYYNYVSFIENYEDTLQKIFKSSHNSTLINNNKIFLWDLQETGLFDNLNINLEDLGLHLKSYEHIVATGPYIRSLLLINNNFQQNNQTFSIRREIYLFKYTDIKWENIVKNINEYKNTENEYYYENNDFKIYLIKKIYKSSSHILLQHDYMKRVGYENGKFYASSMFLIEYQKHKSKIISKFCDPILKLPYDPMGIYYINEKSLKNPLKIIDLVDFDELIKISDKNITKLYNINNIHKTLIELVFDKYIIENNIMLVDNLEKIIIYLLGFKYRRHPVYYAKFLKLYEKNNNLYKLICDNKEFGANEEIKDINDINDINDIIIENFIKNDDYENLIQYLIYLQKKINKIHLDLIIKYNAKDIIEELTKNKILDDYLHYYLVLMSDCIDKYNLDLELNIDIAVNFLKDIMLNGIYSSFNYLIEKDNTIIKITFEEKKNIAHFIKQEGNYQKIIEKIIEIMPELFNICDDNGETPIINYSKHNPEILNYILKYENIDLTITDNYGNTCLHYLCAYDETKLLKYILKKYSELINMPNKNSEYPIIIACKNKREDMFYLLKNNGANLEVKDKYGNTPYHYICANSICIDCEIKNIPNFFGLTPKDYCVLSHKYYNFV